MIITNKLLPVALVAALIGGSVGALVMHSQNDSAQAKSATASPALDAQNVTATNRDQFVPVEFSTSAEQTAYKSGFAEGYQACQAGAAGAQVGTANLRSSQSRVVYRNVGSSSSARRVYYDYQKPQGRSFWQKHRDKLTVAMGTGGGALLGGLIGGKKGAAIGALSGAGGSALYTYKLRNRSRRY
ncbi:MAG TPA: hypothetical protein VLL54_04615 [Pyrinomonadaceae bacterium]|nr:hypothetical protein [Pyrinomonadaceae bacterium]